MSGLFIPQVSRLARRNHDRRHQATRTLPSTDVRVRTSACVWPLPLLEERYLLNFRISSLSVLPALLGRLHTYHSSGRPGPACVCPLRRPNQRPPARLAITGMHADFVVKPCPSPHTAMRSTLCSSPPSADPPTNHARHKMHPIVQPWGNTSACLYTQPRGGDSGMYGRNNARQHVPRNRSSLPPERLIHAFYASSLRGWIVARRHSNLPAASDAQCTQSLFAGVA